MAHEERRKTANVVNAWVACGTLLTRYIRARSFGRDTDKEYQSWRTLYDVIPAYINAPAAAVSPFIFVTNDSYVASDISILAINSPFLEDVRCDELSTSCVSSDDVNKLEEIIVEIIKTCKNG